MVKAGHVDNNRVRACDEKNSGVDTGAAPGSCRVAAPALRAVVARDGPRSNPDTRSGPAGDSNALPGTADMAG